MPELGLTLPISKRFTPVREKNTVGGLKVILDNSYNNLNLSTWVNVLLTLYHEQCSGIFIEKPWMDTPF